MDRLSEILSKRRIIDNIDCDMKFYVVPWALSYTYDSKLFISGLTGYELNKSGNDILEIERIDGEFYCDLMQSIRGDDGAEFPGNIGQYLVYPSNSKWLMEIGHIEIFDKQAGRKETQ